MASDSTVEPRTIAARRRTVSRQRMPKLARVTTAYVWLLGSELVAPTLWTFFGIVLCLNIRLPVMSHSVSLSALYPWIGTAYPLHAVPFLNHDTRQLKCYETHSAVVIIFHYGLAASNYSEYRRYLRSFRSLLRESLFQLPSLHIEAVFSVSYRSMYPSLSGQQKS